MNPQTSIPKTMYELAVIYQVGDQSAPEKVVELIKKAGGQIKRETTWEERDLAYPIKKQTRGVYTFYELDIPGQAINQIESSFNITDGILRHLITKIDHKAQARAETVAKRQAARQAAETETDEAESKKPESAEATTTTPKEQ